MEKKKPGRLSCVEPFPQKTGKFNISLRGRTNITGCVDTGSQAQEDSNISRNPSGHSSTSVFSLGNFPVCCQRGNNDRFSRVFLRNIQAKICVFQRKHVFHRYFQLFANTFFSPTTAFGGKENFYKIFRIYLSLTSQRRKKRLK